MNALQPFPGRSKVRPLNADLKPRFECADRREAGERMCLRCLRNDHALCQSEGCPCACNDSDLRFARNRLTAIGAIDWDYVLAVTK